MIKHIYLFSIKVTKRIFFLITNVIVSLILLVISLMIPKTNRIIVVGGWFGKRFADNSKHLFMYVNENKERLGVDKIVWITRSESIKNQLTSHGFNAYYVWSLLSIWYHFRAKIHLIDQSILDINSFFSIRSKRINLWHGFPLKKIGTFEEKPNWKYKLENNKLISWLNKLSVRGFWGYQYVLATSEFSAHILGKAFKIPKERMIISGYPRNYECFVHKPIKYVPENEKTHLDLVEKAKEHGDIIIGYFPTFRDKKETLIFGTKDRNELQELLDYFKKSNIKVVGKFHFAGKDDEFGDIHKHKVFINLTSDVDVYTFLSEVDILITDYSSIYYDFLLWERPIIFFPYDLDYYRNEDRGLIFEYDEFTPGPKVFDIKDLKALLANGIKSFSDSYKLNYGEAARTLKTKIFGNPEDMKIDHLIEQIRLINKC
jgi:CDP-glycerol glycerophosphotransferase (TagB/SpsB family)